MGNAPDRETPVQIRVTATEPPSGAVFLFPRHLAYPLPMAREKLTKEGIAQAVQLKRAGVRHVDIAASLGVAEATFSRWLNHPKTPNQCQLCQAIKKAEVDRKAALLTMIYNAATSPKTWQAAAWLLERQYPDEFAKRPPSPPEQEAEGAPVIVFDPEAADG